MSFLRSHFFLIFWVLALFTVNRCGYLNDINHLVNSATAHFYTSLDDTSFASKPPAVILFDDVAAEYYDYPVMVPRRALAELLNQIPTHKFKRLGMDIDFSVNASGDRSERSTDDDIALINAIKRHTDAGTEVFAVRNSILASQTEVLPPSPLDAFYQRTDNFLWVQANYRVETGFGFTEAQLVSMPGNVNGEGNGDASQRTPMPHWGTVQSTEISFAELKNAPDNLGYETHHKSNAHSAVLRFMSFNEPDSARYFSRHAWVDVLQHGLQSTRGDQVLIAGSHQLSRDWHETFFNAASEPGIVLNLNAALTMETVGALQPHGVMVELGLLVITLAIFIALTPNTALQQYPLRVAFVRTVCLTVFLVAINYLSIRDGAYFSAVFSVLSVEYIRTGNLFIVKALKKRQTNVA